MKSHGASCQLTHLLPGTLGSVVIAVLDLVRHMSVERGWGESHSPQSR